MAWGSKVIKFAKFCSKIAGTHRQTQFLFEMLELHVTSCTSAYMYVHVAWHHDVLNH